MTEDAAWELTLGTRSGRSIAAEWFDEQGDEALAFALRWAAGRDRCPRPRRSTAFTPREATPAVMRGSGVPSAPPEGHDRSDVTVWVWERVGRWRPDSPFRLPYWLFTLLPGFQLIGPTASWVMADTLPEAWRALATALTAARDGLVIHPPLGAVLPWPLDPLK